jgi:glycosyltransferase involved in cell wall biosynthesis
MAPIDKKNEIETAEILATSSIFLSFCEQEGCPLPPLEAAFSGNIVVGYTGQGAKEYFAKPLFREIENGNFHDFAKAVLTAIADVETGLLHSQTFKNQFDVLRKNYSNESEYKMLFDFARMVYPAAV